MTFVRPFVRLALSVVTFMAAAAAPPANADDWPKPAEWGGKYPFGEANHAEFYYLASIRAALMKLVGEQFYRRVILEWTEVDPVRVEGDSMLVEGCKPHACGDDQVTTLVQGRSITVCAYHIFWPKDYDTKPFIDERIWFIDGVGLPIVEYNPQDPGTGCGFQSVESAKMHLRHVLVDFPFRSLNPISSE